jgi:hypothetical protein
LFPPGGFLRRRDLVLIAQMSEESCHFRQSGWQFQQAGKAFVISLGRSAAEPGECDVALSLNARFPKGLSEVADGEAVVAYEDVEIETIAGL